MIWFGPWLLRQASRLPPGEKWFKFTYLEMVVMFRGAMEEWALTDAVLYRMRHRGASHDIVSNQRSMLEVKKRGRWANDQSLKRYAKGVRLQKVELEAGRRLSPEHANTSLAYHTSSPQGFSGDPRHARQILPRYCFRFRHVFMCRLGSWRVMPSF